MNYSPQKDDPELLDQLCQAIATQEVPALVSEPMMPWSKMRTLRLQLPTPATLATPPPKKSWLECQAGVVRADSKCRCGCFSCRCLRNVWISY